VFRKVFVILLTLLLLQPTGFCLCRLSACLPRAAERTNANTSADKDNAFCQPCGCKHCQCRALAAKSASHNLPSPNHESPAPDPDQYPPGCPAHPASAVTHVSTLANAIQFVDLCSTATASLWLPLAEGCPDLLMSPFATQSHFLSPPLFVLCCDFRC